MVNTWESNPQDPADDHEWVRWFDDPRKYRGKIWSEKAQEWIKEPSQ
jgi:hypothetical protein